MFLDFCDNFTSSEARSASASSMESFNANDELARLGDRLNMKLVPVGILHDISNGNVNSRFNTHSGYYWEFARSQFC